MHGSLQIHNNFYFDSKVYFIHFSIIKLKRKERKLSKNYIYKKKILVVAIQNSLTWC
jgi:hypothetical protein